MNSTKHPKWIKSGFLAFAQRLSLPIFGFGSFLILVRGLSEAQMGTWALFISFTTIVEVAKNGLIKPSLIKFLNSSDEKSKIETASIFINCIYTLFIVFTILFSSDYLSQYLQEPEFRRMLNLHIFSLILLVPFSHFEFIQQANSDFLGVFWSYFLRQFLIFSGILILYFLAQDIRLYQLVVIHTFSILFGSLVSLKFARKYLKISDSLSFVWVRKLWNYGRFVFITNISSNIFRNTDHIMVASFISLPAVAYYNLSARIINLLDLPSTAIGDVLFPKSVQVLERDGKQGIKELFEKVVGYTLSVMIPSAIFIFLFSDSIIYLIAGEQYINASKILKISTIYVILLPFMKQFGTIINAIGKPQLNFYLIIILAFFNLTSNYIFIHFFGLLGAAYGTLSAYLFGFIFIQFNLRNEIKVNTLSIFKNMILFYGLLYKFLYTKYKDINQ